MRRRHLFALVMMAMTASWWAMASEAHAAEDKSGVLTVWTVTTGGKAIGTESLRVVRSDTGAFFASGTQKLKAAKLKSDLKSHVQRDPDGRLAKYRRVETKRKGKGLFIFKRDAGARIVGINSDDKQADFSTLVGQHIWDPALWHDLALLVPRIAGDGDVVSVDYFDVEARKAGKATFTRGATTQVTDDKGGLVAVTSWAIGGAPGSARTLFVDGKKRLVGVRGEDREMLLKDWTWDDGTKASGGDDDETTAPAGDDDAEGGEGGEGEVGP
ncbi:MAG: hypothetical protein EP329_19315 [Deltaproteobacteria bacterium]|nr:MAG: hypothetical protein EP329_19315 [Deltaproteobacteria bacterium]